ncbi:U4/U6 small nuclear ribonucleoprotein Prp3-like [Clavelina lepadiformis]|uniref:U4/U6 small nuclear ribonucleoprotein Prp3-like n=1 Tax=Clavelina lepadiformis TaxID=159417 RepID=UPI0040420EDE
MFLKIDSVKMSRKRKDVGDDKEEPKKIRRFIEPDLPTTTSAVEGSGTLTHQQIKVMMENARRQIEQRKVELQQMNPTVLSTKVDQVTDSIHNNSDVMNNSIDKAQKAAELQKRIQARLAAKPGLLSGVTAGLQANLFSMPTAKVPEKSAPTPLILDEMGRTVDSSGHVLQIPNRAPTLKANIRAKKREEFRQKLQEKPTQDLSSGSSQYFDKRVKQESALRSRRNFKFHEKGRFVQIAQKIRTKAQLEKLQGEIAQAAKRTGIQQASKLALIAPKVGAESIANAIPDIEWWDKYIIDNEERDFANQSNIVSDVLTNLIEHPTQIIAPGEDITENPVLGTYLTKKERKKLRRMNRREALKDEQEKVRLGLIPAPEPKVKLSNLMRVLGTDAVQDPTKVEKHVRMQMAKRQRAHEQANAARKLTTEQKKEKRIRKLKENTSDTVHITMYRVHTLRDPSKRFKIEMNSKQLYMTGCTVLHPDINVVVVEGGPKAQRKFKRLMLVRIKWDEDKKGKRIQDTGLEEGEKMCELIWEGQASSGNFGDMTFKQCTTDEEAHYFFKKHGVEHYWDLAHSQKLLED